MKNPVVIPANGIKFVGTRRSYITKDGLMRIYEYPYQDGINYTRKAERANGCLLSFLGNCFGRVEVHDMFKKKGQKRINYTPIGDEYRQICLCQSHHKKIDNWKKPVQRARFDEALFCLKLQRNFSKLPSEVKLNLGL